MIFSEIYSIYYQAVSKILTAARKGAGEQEFRDIVAKNAFSESHMTILPALKSGRWPLLRPDGAPVLKHDPTMPLTHLEKRWLKALLDDPRVQLFQPEFPDLSDVTPLFTQADYKLFDQYADGDPYDDPDYIRIFRLLLEGIRTQRPVQVLMTNRQGRDMWVRFYPRELEYSSKDDKFRVLTDGCRFHHINVGRILDCTWYEGFGSWKNQPPAPVARQVTLEITDQRGALERVMLHFAHFEKQASRIDDTHYLLRLQYLEPDETELLIRILSFGPHVRIVEPDPLADALRRRLTEQKSCGI